MSSDKFDCAGPRCAVPRGDRPRQHGTSTVARVIRHTTEPGSRRNQRRQLAPPRAWSGGPAVQGQPAALGRIGRELNGARSRPSRRTHPTVAGRTDRAGSRPRSGPAGRPRSRSVRGGAGSARRPGRRHPNHTPPSDEPAGQPCPAATPNLSKLPPQHYVQRPILSPSDPIRSGALPQSSFRRGREGFV